MKLEREDLLMSNALLPLSPRRLFEGYDVSLEEHMPSCRVAKQPTTTSGKKTPELKVRRDQRDFWNCL